MNRQEARKQSIILKYGSWDNYEKLRAEKTREAALSRCATEEDRRDLQRRLERKDFLRVSVNVENIGKKISCTKCGKEFKAGKNQHLYCSKCALEEARIFLAGSLEKYFEVSSERNKKTKLEKYGDSGYNNRTKAEETCLKTYGTKHQNQNEIQKAKIAKTKLERYGDSAFNNREKTIQTLREQYGNDITSTAQLEEVKQKARLTKLERYGDEQYNNKFQTLLTCQDRYGGNAPACNIAVQQKIQQTMIEKYGVAYPLQSPEITEKITQTNLERYGVENAMQNETIRNRSVRTRLDKYGSFINFRLYRCDSFVFDSSYELAYYIYLRDHKIQFILKPDPIRYYDKDKIPHNYFPDFKVEGQYVEIKGEYFIDEDGTLVHPLTRKKLIEKTECMKENNVKVLLKKDLKKIFTYVESTYGKHYLNSLMEHSND